MILGGTLAFAAAVTFAANNAMMRRGVLTGSVAQAMGITVPLGAALLLLAVLASGTLPLVLGMSFGTLAWLGGAGILHFIIGRYGNFRATKAMGANLVGPVQQLSVVVTLAMALMVIGETLTMMRLAGIVLVVASPLVMLRRRSVRVVAPVYDARESVFVPNLREGYSFAMLSVFGYGMSPILLRMGMPEGAGISHGLAAAFVAYTMAAMIVGLVMLLPGQMRHMLSINRPTLTWFTLSGVMVCLSQMFFFMAVALVPVSVALPIQRISIVLRLGFARLINPGHEVFGGRMVAATIVSLFGALLLTLSVDMVAHALGLPGNVVDWLNLRWP